MRFAQCGFQRLQNVVSAARKGIFFRPNFLNDFKARVSAIGMNAQEPTARGQSFGQRRNDLLHFEFHRHACPVRLRCNDQIMICFGLANARYYPV